MDARFRRRFVFAAFLLFALLSTQPVIGQVVHLNGTVVDLDSRCPGFRAADGTVYDLINPDPALLGPPADSLCVEAILLGETRCRRGPAIEILRRCDDGHPPTPCGDPGFGCDVPPLLSPLFVVGAVRPGVEAGCVVLTTGGSTYLLMGGRGVPLGQRVWAFGFLVRDVISYCMQGVPFVPILMGECGEPVRICGELIAVGDRTMLTTQGIILPLEGEVPFPPGAVVCTTGTVPCEDEGRLVVEAMEPALPTAVSPQGKAALVWGALKRAASGANRAR